MSAAYGYANETFLFGRFPEDAELQAPLRILVESLVAERDALRTDRDTLRQVIEQQLLNVPVVEWKK